MTVHGATADQDLPLAIYLGPTLARWRPRSITDVETVIVDGTLRERHWLDVKAEFGRSDGAKKDFACDLASFANDGGALLIGVREDKRTQTLAVAEVPLEGLAERVDEIARSRCDPPLYVACHPLAGTPDAMVARRECCWSRFLPARPPRTWSTGAISDEATPPTGV
jgi:hypothetical protein